MAALYLKIKETLPTMSPYFHLMALALPLIFLNKESYQQDPILRQLLKVKIAR